MGDFDGDGRRDFPALGGGALTTFGGDGKGGFTASKPTAYAGRLDVATGDLHGDGVPDIVFTRSSAGGSSSEVRGRGDGTLLPPVLHHRLRRSVERMAAGDFNGDGRTDLTAGSYDAATPTVENISLFIQLR